MSSEVYNSVYASGSSPGILYGLPKIHKTNFSSAFQFRPIFASYNTPAYKLAKYLVPYLSHLTVNMYTVDNSSSFVKCISNYSNADKLFMVSYDIENLFTNVPLGETISIILDQLFTTPNSVYLNMCKDLFKKLLNFAVSESFFIFDDKLYRQRDGLGMGLPLSPSFANIFLSYHEQKWLSECPPNFAPVFYKRYVDDTFVLFNNPSHAQLFLNYINCKHNSINFTMETEINKQLSFLDTLVTRSNDKFDISVHRKPTFTWLGTSFFSFCPLIYKINSIKTLLHRAYAISSSYFSLHNEFCFLKKYFHNNGFPIALVNSCVSKFLNSIYANIPNPDNISSQKFYVSLPYFGHLSENFKKEFLILLKQYFPNIDFHIVLSNNYRICNLFNFKDRLPLELRSSLVYKFSCTQCVSSYIGSTSRALAVRVSEHKGVSVRTGRMLAAPSHSNIREHVYKCNSPLSIDQFKILESCNNNIDLRILESLYIYKTQPSLNNMQSAHPLYLVNK